MHRTQYDSDVTVWSPQGRIYQIEYAMEAVKQGSACAAAKSETHCVIAAFKRVETQKKIYKIDDQIGVAVSGLNADARNLTHFMKEECLVYKFNNEAHIPVSRLVLRVADQAQERTLGEGPRPFGVGLLVAGVDKTGPRIFQADPSGNYTEYYAQTLGAKSQAVKTYLERHYKKFTNASLPQLIAHVVSALQASSPDEDLDANTLALAHVGIGEQFKEYTPEEVTEILARVKTFNPTTSEFEIDNQNALIANQ
ncbi:MAG: putative Proteasome subunit alpha type-1 [Streblomastix strix]|uniref:Proteasome subunit alpha type n=1 Tax=Streblomastix strix TaxID=222440 RepID=A0A5J4WGW9_9EUKA|nr:MAG: putative Proteasome subunit alpha type-1 [Streblomastix strix]